jgi:steroid 5-alpha reductase family enzyme
MPSVLEPLIIVLAISCTLWLWSLKSRNAAIADVFWPLYHIVCSASYFLQSPKPGVFATLVFSTTVLWGLRLSFYLLKRQAGKAEDHRYASIRSARNQQFPFFSLFLIFLPQAFMAWVICLALQPLFHTVVAVTWTHWLFLFIAASGLIFEIVADHQLTRFRALRRPDAVLNSGLWRYSRHPNYFGEWLFWLGLSLISLHHTFWQPIVAMVLVTFLLTRFTGAKRMESNIENRRPEYAQYIKSTSGFFPWKPLLCAAVFSLSLVIPDIQAEEPTQDRELKTEYWYFQAFIDSKEVGYHAFTASHSNSGIELRGEANFIYKVMGMTFFSYDHVVEETYNSDFCLQQISSQTSIKRESLVLHGRQTAQGFAINSPSEKVYEVQCIIPFAYWSPKFLHQQLLLNGQDGNIVYVSISRKEQKPNSEGSSFLVTANKMSITIHYDAAGNWVGLISELPANRKLIYKLIEHRVTQHSLLATSN